MKYKVLCAHCGDEYVRHTKVQIFERQEGKQEKFHLIVDQEIHLDYNMTDNPSCSRNGLIVHLRCENCNELSLLKLEQHEGRTFLTATIGDRDE